ncbi:MAG: AraC family transcriptional regulator [Acidobacteria bacterium]|nr:AraC family transcriptional regulator [Acidobacteriota bacterium]
MTFFWIGKTVPRAPLIYSAGIVILGQGHKVGYLGDRRFEYDAESCLVLGIPVPFECESHGTPEEPLLGIRIDIDLATVHGLVARFGGRLGLERRKGVVAQSGVEPLAMDADLVAATVRLLESLRDPMDRQVVGPAAVDEIFYRVLRSAKGHVLYDLTQHQTPYSNVAQALDRMHRDYRESLSVEDLARESAMGVSSFHRAFKEITGDSPVQYLKKVRLLKAKGLLVFEGRQVSEAAYEVGYASPSQFSREFKRYFRVPPSEAESLPYNDAA